MYEYVITAGPGIMLEHVATDDGILIDALHDLANVKISLGILIEESSATKVERFH